MEDASLQESLVNNEENKTVRMGSLFFTIFILSVVPRESKETWLHIREKVNFRTYTMKKEIIGQKKL